ncbi:MAG: glycosyltransferase [Desulfobacterales bacterium]|nr:glycosyltransferase [Desulfobacterales bacterium]
MAADIIAIFAGLLLFGHFVGLGLLTRNLRWLRWQPETRKKPLTDISVSVIVPARNEAEGIELCLRSLLAQTHVNLQLIVVNDHSEDDTPDIIDRIAAEDPRMIVIHNPPLESGWLGKHNAMQAALAHVESDLLVLTDADVEFEPTCISSAVSDLQARQLDLLSIYPQFQFVTFCETILLPIYLCLSSFLLSPAVEDPKSAHAMAVGAFILLRRDRLNQIGGFASIRTKILDDVAIARSFKKNGFTISLRSAPDLMRVRFFKNNRHAFFGVSKHLLGIAQSCIWLAPLLAIGPLLVYGTAFFAVIHGIVQQRFILAGIGILMLLINYIGLLLTRPNYKFNALKALAFPCLSILFAASCLRALYLFLCKGRFQWRGRDTDLKSTR